MSETAADPEFGPAWFDVDEQREEPIPHRYLHGGFEGTNTRFRIRFPAAETYRGRMLQLLGGGQGGTELLTDGVYGGTAVDADDRSIPSTPPEDAKPHRQFVEAAKRGAFLVECNEGFRAGIDDVPDDLTLTAYRAIAHTARYAIDLAREHYGSAPEHRYVTGFSGGGNRTINVLENTDGIFHGGVGGGITTMELSVRSWSVVAEAVHVLGPILDDIAANADAGGSGDVFAATRTEEERHTLAELYRSGYPFGNERALKMGGSWSAGWHYLAYADPDYLHDLFHTPGYAGHDGEIVPLRAEATVVAYEAAGEWRRILRLDRDPADLFGAEITVLEGPRAGTRRLVTGVSGESLDTVALWHSGPSDLEPGDRVSIDNSRWLAVRWYHRDAHRRPPARFAASVEYTGDLHGKLLLVEPAHDSAAMTNTTDAYIRRVKDPSVFRGWWLEHAEHGGPAPGIASTRWVEFADAMTQSIDDLIAWVEDGTPPAPSTRYEIDADGILRMPATAGERLGIQPTVLVEANGGRRIEARAGEPVAFRAIAEAPPGSEIVELSWDPIGLGEWDTETYAAPEVTSERSHVYSEPGAYRAAVRVRSRRPGAPYVVENLGHARIVVG